MTERAVSAIDKAVTEVWDDVIQICNLVMKQANIYGFELMGSTEPNVHQVSKLLDSVISPLLDTMMRIGDFSPESGIKIANIRQYNLHLREISLALDKDDKQAFKAAVKKLSSEAHIILRRSSTSP